MDRAAIVPGLLWLLSPPTTLVALLVLGAVSDARAQRNRRR